MSESSTDSICFRRGDFQLYSFLLAIVVFYLFYILYKSVNIKDISKEQYIQKEYKLLEMIDNLQKKLLQCSNVNEKSQQRQSLEMTQVDTHLNRVYNPLYGPERTYPNGKLQPLRPIVRNTSNDYQQIGFVFNNDDRLPLFARPKYPGKTDKYEYYLIDQTRNRLKIPFKSKNDNELYDGDNIHIDVLNNDYTVKIYEYDNLKYDPDRF